MADASRMSATKVGVVDIRLTNCCLTNLKLIIRVINFGLVPTYMLTVPQRYGRTDGRLTIAIPRFALRASRGKNV